MEDKKSFFEIIIDAISWLKIVASPTIFGVVIGFIVYKTLEESNRGALLFGFISAIGLILGIIWANKIAKKHGTTNYLSKVDASPDID